MSNPAPSSDEPANDVTHAMLWSARLAGRYEPTGKTIHYYKNERLGAPTALQIVRYPGDEGCYLLYLDENGKEMTDTYHDDVKGAMDQARFEFSIPPEAWVEEGSEPR